MLAQRSNKEQKQSARISPSLKIENLRSQSLDGVGKTSAPLGKLEIQFLIDW